MRSPLPVIVIAAITATVLSGCIGGEPPTPPVAEIEKVDVPDSMLASQPTASVAWRILPATETRPWLIGGSLSAPGEGGVPTVWTSPDGSEWTTVTVTDDFTGSFTGALSGSEELAALGGTVWAEGRSTSVLWTSEDGDTWEPRDLPDDFADGFGIVGVTVAESTVVVIATDADGATRGIRVDEDGTAEFELPPVGDGDRLYPSQLLAAGDDLILLASPGPEGESSPTVTYVSDDQGESWSDSGEIAKSPAYVYGIAATEDGFVATGAAPRDESSAATGAAAWFSPDGLSWTAESVPVSGDGPLFYASSADAWFGTPLAGPAGVTAIFANDNASVSGVYTRTSGGVWTQTGTTSVNPTNGLGGFGVSADGATTVVMMGGSSYARLATVTGGAWNDTTVLAAREDLNLQADIYPADDRTLITVSRGTFTPQPDFGWSNTYAYQLGELTDAELAFEPWDPERVAALASVVLGASDGAEVVLGSSFVPGTDVITVEGWFRATPDAAWTPATGFPGAGAMSFDNVAKIGETWIAVGTLRATSGVGDPEHGTIWTSSDGVSWSELGGDFGTGALESAVVDVCALPDGGAVAVGWVEEADSDFHTAVWAQGDAGWSRLDIADLGEAEGYTTACAADEDGIVLAATVSGRDTLYRSTDGSSWDEVFRADSGTALGEPVAVPGGFAAPGSYSTDTFESPVVWLSTDGVDWSPLAVPSFAPGSTWEVAPAGDDLIVTMSPRVGHPVSIVHDIERLVADTAG